MPVARSKKLAIVERRKNVADLYIQGWTQTEIAQHLGYTQGTMCADLQWIRKEWRESMVRDFDLAREIELKKLDRIEREAWAAWERSQQPAQSAHINDETSHRKTRRHIRNQYGEAQDAAVEERAAQLHHFSPGLLLWPAGERDRPVADR